MDDNGIGVFRNTQEIFLTHQVAHSFPVVGVRAYPENTLVICCSLLLNMAMEIVDLPSNNCDFPHLC